MVWHRKYFLSGPIKACGVIFRQQHTQFGLGQGRAGPGVSYAKAHSVILQEAIYDPSVDGEPEPQRIIP